MKVHRFYVDSLILDMSLDIKDKFLLYQWNNVLRFKPGTKIELFNNRKELKEYKITRINKKSASLEITNELKPLKPQTDLYLCFALLKKDKNEWVLQKATELGVRGFIPLITDRTEKTGFNLDRSKKIIIEAVEQCGRSDIPEIIEPIKTESALKLMEGRVIFIAEQGGEIDLDKIKSSKKPLAIFIGPEGGWSDNERILFKDKNIQFISLSRFTLRAETASIIASGLLQ